MIVCATVELVRVSGQATKLMLGMFIGGSSWHERVVAVRGVAALTPVCCAAVRVVPVGSRLLRGCLRRKVMAQLLCTEPKDGCEATPVPALRRLLSATVRRERSGQSNLGSVPGGEPRRLATRATRQGAERVASELLQESRLQNSTAVCGISLEMARRDTFQGLPLLTGEPSTDVSDPRIHAVLAAALSPADTGRVTEKLMGSKFTSAEYSSEPSTSGWRRDYVPCVSDAAAPAWSSQETRHEPPVEPEAPGALSDTVPPESAAGSDSSLEAPWDGFRSYLDTVTKRIGVFRIPLGSQ